MSIDLPALLQRSAARHSHLCPRQVLGVRMGLAGLAALKLAPPISKDTGLVIVETDGCFVDGIEVSTGATVGHRTLRVHDFGKIAATFVRIGSAHALRISPDAAARARAPAYAPGVRDRYRSQLAGYETMPDAELFRFEDVVLQPTLTTLIGAPDLRVHCSRCGEEIINAREIVMEGAPICQPCSGRGYYRPKFDPLPNCTVEATAFNPTNGGQDEPTTQALSRIP